jgi:hypothetical protein
MKSAIIIIICMTLICGCSGIIVHVPDETPVPTPTPTPTPNGSYAMITDENGTPLEKITTRRTLAPNETPTIPEITPRPEDFNQTVGGAVTPSTTVATIAPTKTRRTPKPTPVPVITMNESQPYLKYSDNDFSISYPSNWSYENSTVNFMTSSMNSETSFETKARKTVFHGVNSSVNLTVVVADLMVPGTGRFRTDINSCADSAGASFDGIDGMSSLAHYSLKYTNEFHTPYVRFDIVLPEQAAAYPLAYTEQDLMSYNHYYQFRFYTPGTATDYDNFRDYMLLSIKTEEQEKPTGWIP